MMIETLNFLDSWLVLRDWDCNSVRVGGRHDGCGGMGGSMDGRVGGKSTAKVGLGETWHQVLAWPFIETKRSRHIGAKIIGKDR